MLKFYWNGIKQDGGKLQRCSYGNGQLINHPAGTLTIYAKEYGPLSKEINEQFRVQNDSDGMTDYFEKDRIRVAISHPLYSQVLAAFEAQQAHNAKRFAKRQERLAA